MKSNRLEAHHVTKRFGGVQALRDASIEVRPGEVHALVGENGAGKSTLMKVFSGAHERDGGDLFMDGKTLEIHGPRSALDKGIATIYQEMNLAPHLSVAENIYIDQLAESGPFLNWKKLYREASAQLARLGFEDINPDAEVRTLPVAHQQVVEICKALTHKANVLVLDEPTAVLTFAETQKLFQIIKQLSDEGVSVIYISHRLEEIFEICDRITVMKDGAFVGCVTTQDVSKAQLVSMMVGRDLEHLFPPRQTTIGEPVLIVKNLSSGKEVRDLSFSAHAGEVLVLTGLVGAGRTEALKAIFGDRKVEHGEITLRGDKVVFHSPQQAVRNKFGLLPEDRKHEGLILEQSIRANVTLASLDRFTNKLGFIRKKTETDAVTRVLSSLSTKYASMEDPASSLSGGNQQKLVVAKWMLAECECIVFDEPTRGVDVGAKTEIYTIINELAAQGVAVIVISSEMPEVIGIADRALVIREGKLAGEVAGINLTEERLIQLSMGVSEE